MKQKRTDLMDEYLDIDERIKYLTQRKKEIREQVIKDLLKSEYEGLVVSKKEVVTWNDDLFYKWVCDKFPQVVDSVTKRTIDYSLFEKLVMEGKIVYDDIPSEVYKVRVDYSIRQKD